MSGAVIIPGAGTITTDYVLRSVHNALQRRVAREMLLEFSRSVHTPSESAAMCCFSPKVRSDRGPIGYFFIAINGQVDPFPVFDFFSSRLSHRLTSKGSGTSCTWSFLQCSGTYVR